MTASKFINDLVGKKVTVWSKASADVKDEGTLDGFDGWVVRLRKENKGKEDILLFPIASIRLIKENPERF